MGMTILVCGLALNLHLKNLRKHFFTVDMRFYFTCCRDGAARESSTACNSTKKRAKGESREINAVCISRMYVTRHSQTGLWE